MTLLSGCMLNAFFPEVSKGTLEQCIVSLQDSAEETPTWNRRIRRKCLRSQGVVVHAFCGSARKAFESVSHLWDLTHLGVDASEDILNDKHVSVPSPTGSRGQGSGGSRGTVGSHLFCCTVFLQKLQGKALEPMECKTCHVRRRHSGMWMMC